MSNFYEDLLSGEEYTDSETTAGVVLSGEHLEAAYEMGQVESHIEAMAAAEGARVDASIALMSLPTVEMSGEARDVHIAAITALGGMYGFSGEGFMDKVKSVGKSIEIYARKFIAFVGKWIAKAGTLFGAFESTRKECLAAVEAATDKTEIELTQSWVNKATAFFGAAKKGKSSNGLAILSFNDDLIRNDGREIRTNFASTTLEMNTFSNIPTIFKMFSGTDKIEAYINKAKAKDNDGGRVFVTASFANLGRGKVAVLATVTTAEVKPGELSEAFTETLDSKPVESKLFYINFKFKDPAFKVGKNTVGGLNIDLSTLKEVLGRDGKDRRVEIEKEYTVLKFVLGIDTSKAADAKEAAAIKQIAINTSKVLFKRMFAVNAAFKDGIRVGKMIKAGKTPDAEVKK